MIEMAEKTTEKMNIEDIVDAAYETQHFGFHPRDFIDAIYNVYYENIFAACNQYQAFLCSEFEGKIKPETIKQNTEELFKTIIKALDYSMDRLELHANSNTFPIDDNVVLPEDKVHITHPCTEENELALNKEIEELILQIQKEIHQKNIIKCKLEEQKHVKNFLMLTKKKFEETSSTLKNLSETATEMTAKCLEAQNLILDHSKKVSVKTSEGKEFEIIS